MFFMFIVARTGVAPLAGAWIETHSGRILQPHTHVAPLAGAWIETRMAAVMPFELFGRAPRGRVD